MLDILSSEHLNCKFNLLSVLQRMGILYIALWITFHALVPIMQLIEEIKHGGFQVLCTLPHKAFDEKSSALELATVAKQRSCTKHITGCYHHFKEQLHHRRIKIFPIDSGDWPADIAKAVAHEYIARES